MQISFITDTALATELLAEKIGARLKGGEVIELVSDLGGGKTTFMRGLARGAKSTDSVTSPTFTVSKVYQSPGFEIHHFDFYRLPDPGLMIHELEDLVGDPGAVVAVEWADAIQQVLPEGRLTITIESHNESQRNIIFLASPILDYLLEDVC